MNADVVDAVGAAIVAFLIGFLAGGLVMERVARSRMEREAVAHEVAHWEVDADGDTEFCWNGDKKK